MSVEVRKSVLIPIERIHPNDWNPNEQSEETFNQFVEEIREDGFEQPLNVVPKPNSKWDKEEEDEIDWVGLGTESGKCKHFVVIGGEHRLKAAKVLDIEMLPCYVHPEWDEMKARLKTVRRNLLTGQLNDAKFTSLAKSLNADFEIPKEQLPRLLGFDSEMEFAKHYIEEKDKSDKTFLDGLVDESKKESYAVQSLTEIVSTIFSESGDTIDQNFIHFTFKGSLQTMILCDKETLSEVERMVSHLKDNGESATDFIKEALKNHLSMAD